MIGLVPSDVHLGNITLGRKCVRNTVMISSELARFGGRKSLKEERSSHDQGWDKVLTSTTLCLIRVISIWVIPIRVTTTQRDLTSYVQIPFLISFPTPSTKDDNNNRLSSILALPYISSFNPRSSLGRRFHLTLPPSMSLHVSPRTPFICYSLFHASKLKWSIYPSPRSYLRAIGRVLAPGWAVSRARPCLIRYAEEAST